MKTPSPHPTRLKPDQAARLLFNQSSLRRWQAQYKAQQATQAGKPMPRQAKA